MTTPQRAVVLAASAAVFVGAWLWLVPYVGPGPASGANSPLCKPAAADWLFGQPSTNAAFVCHHAAPARLDAGLLWLAVALFLWVVGHRLFWPPWKGPLLTD
jgi:hypothetical protein